MVLPHHRYQAEEDNGQGHLVQITAQIQNKKPYQGGMQSQRLVLLIKPDSVLMRQSQNWLRSSTDMVLKEQN